jgi:alcohol dehydrogenase
VLVREKQSPEDTARAGIDALEDHFASLNIPTRLRDIVSDRSTLPQVCDMASRDACLLTNPREATAEDMLAVCEGAW